MRSERIHAPDKGWASLKVDELKEQLEARGLPKSGKKDELIARLEEHEAGGGAETPVAEAEEAAAEEAAPKPARRRGSAETSAPAETKKREPRRDADGDVVVRARSRYVRSAPRKARLVMDHIRGKEVDQARAILSHTPRHAAAERRAAELGRRQPGVQLRARRGQLQSSGPSSTRAPRSSASGRGRSGVPPKSASARAT